MVKLPLLINLMLLMVVHGNFNSLDGTSALVVLQLRQQFLQMVQLIGNVLVLVVQLLPKLVANGYYCK